MRPDVLNPLFAEVEALKGVGPGIAKALTRLDLTRAIDLAYHLPTGVIERVRAPYAAATMLGRIVVLDVTPVQVRAGSGRAPLRILAEDGSSNTLTLTFFNNPAWAKKQLPLNEQRTVIGKLDAWGNEWQIVHPEVLEPSKVGDIPLREPVYGLTEGISNKRMRELALTALERAPELPEWIEPSQLGRDHWPHWRSALAEVHSDPSATIARKRLAYDEIFANQLALLLLRQVARRKRGVPLQGDGRLTDKLQLPYRLTGAQQRVIGEIRGDMAQDKPMLRLLQGDVGSGKTLVALLAMLEAVEAGAQAAMLAPTEILARQHLATLQRQCAAIGVNIAILTGREKGKARESVLMGLADGSIDILVGTHAIFQQHVAYQKLGLIVIDEQHRFGVSQRLLLSEKADRPPHLLAMLEAVEAGAQAAMLAPTEILARQHLATLQRQCEAIGVRIGILTGREKGKARESVLMGLADGSIDILVGTHAIFQQHVAYQKLGLIVIDEQHRFGVSQRLLLSEKADRPPHLLAMTATPIPRTLTLTHYGEMDVSRIDEMPPGRTPVETLVISDGKLADVVDGLGRHLAAGGQAFWVCPLVEESEAIDAAAAEDRAVMLRQRFGEAQVGLVHGRLKGPEKDDVMASFANGELKVLVATTVIEVGVDVPNATLMIVEGAERFGLAQLHQLRGRVGRGAGASRCILLRGQNLSETGRARLTMMRETNDGFRIAEEDLRLRGPGEILGTRQSGEQNFRVAGPEDVAELAPIAQRDARLLLDRDGGLASERGQAARLCLYLFERDAAVGLLRSG